MTDSGGPPPPDRQPVRHHSAGAVVIDERRCLLLRRGRTWVFPKGHLEAGETAQDAARREVREETGLDVAIDDYLGVTRYGFRSPDGRANRKRVDWFAAHPLGGAIELEPHFSEARFVDREEALRLLTFRNDRRIVERAFTTAAPHPAESQPAEG